MMAIAVAGDNKRTDKTHIFILDGGKFEHKLYVHKQYNLSYERFSFDSFIPFSLLLGRHLMSSWSSKASCH